MVYYLLVTCATCRIWDPSCSVREHRQLDPTQAQLGHHMASSQQLQAVAQAYVAETEWMEVVEKQTQKMKVLAADPSPTTGHLTCGQLQFSVAVAAFAQQPGHSKQ